jgi:hypothetical protein
LSLTVVTISVLITEVVGRQVLAGRVAGQTDYPQLEQAARAAASPDGRVLLDLAGIEVLSSSYFDAALWPLWSLTPELYPGLVRVPQAAVDDMELVLRANQAAVWSFKTEADRRPRLLGVIDPALRLTLDRVAEHGELTAGDLVEAKGSIGATAWSNRLASLHQLRLVRRRKDGRRLIYLLAWKE